MRTNRIFAALLLLVAGLQTAWAQKVLLYKTNSQVVEYEVSELDSIVFVEAEAKLVQQIVLSVTSLSLQPNDMRFLTATVLPENAQNKVVTWQSSDTNVAEVNQSGRVIANANGTCVITCRATDGSGVKATCQVTVGGTTPDEHEYVDLFLPSGTLWATCNVGANSPEEYGDYFAWGETTTKSEYSWGTYKWLNEGQSSWTQINKYTSDDELKSACWYSNGIFIGDNNLELEPEDDAATANWGSEWRMPDHGNLRELINSSYTTTEWITVNGVSGRKITSKVNGNSIFLPAAGYREETSLTNDGSHGYYWSRKLDIGYSYQANVLGFSSGGVYTRINDRGVIRCYGQSVRPVRVTSAPPRPRVTSITLNQTSFFLEVGKTQALTATVLPSNAINKEVTWTSSDTSVATVSTSGMVTAKAIGTSTITCSATDGSGVKAECKVKVFIDNSGTINGRDYVDLGLPSGTKWATCNVGASRPEDYGDYFAWGEITTNSSYYWSSYKYFEDSKDAVTKYCTQSNYGYNGFTDNLTELQPADDAATARWGSGWQMPSLDQMVELYNSSYTTTEWTQVNGVNGRKVTSKSNGNSIFLPAAGYRFGTDLNYKGSSGFYWSRSLYPDYSLSARYLTVYSNGIYTANGDRYYGRSVRPVRFSSVQRVTSITLSQTSLSLEVGKTQTLTAAVLPSNATNKTVVWTSSNTSVATVFTSGMVTAKASGTCTITCAATDGSGVKAECQLTVVLPVTGITISPSTLTLEPGKTQTLTATVLPSNATNKAVTWTSSNTSVATVSTSGMVTAKASGTCTITCAATDGSGVKAECQVTVGSSTPDEHEYVDLGLPSGTLWATCNVGASKSEEFGDYFAWGETTPKNTYDWSTYFDTDDGGRTFKKYNNNSGLSELQPADDAATANWGSGWKMPSVSQINELCNSKYTTSEWTQQNDVSGHKVTSKSNGNSIFLPAAGYRIDASLYDAGTGGYYWSNSLGMGSGGHTASGLNSDYILDWDDCTRYNGRSVRAVRVSSASPVQLVTSITLSQTSLSIEVGKTQTLTATVLPSNATNKAVTWTSSNTSVATVSTSGMVTAKASGTCTITCSATDGSGVKATCQVTVGAAGQTYTVNGVSFNMISVAGGTFQMGSTTGNSDEQPVHQVTLSSFSIGETEVTQELWQAVMGSNPSNFKGNKLPVEQVSWNNCQTFITKLNQLTGKTFRLPTEAEWEYAARGGNQSKGYTYSGSNTIGDVAWYRENSYDLGSSSPDYGTHPVATKAANELGIYDMSGNVWEWCQDWKGAYSSGSQTNPTGPSSGSYRVIRGGGWCNLATVCRVAFRGNNSPTSTNNFIGFRLTL